MANPRPDVGIGMIANFLLPALSSSLKVEKKFVAASRRSPVGLKFTAPSGAKGPNPTKTSPSTGAFTLSRSDALGA